MSGGRWRRIWHLGLKELASLWRDRVMVVFVIYALTIAVVMSVNQAVDLRHAAIAVLDDDRSALSRRIAAAFLPPRFQRAVPIEAPDIAPALESGRATFVLVIPPRFEADVLAGRRPVLQLNIDGTAVAQALAGAGDVERIAIDEIARTVPQAASAGGLRLVTRVRYNSNLESAWFLSVGEVLLMVTVLAFILPAVSLIREREHGTMAHLLVMPLGAGEIVAAKLWANGVVIVAGSALSLIGVVHGYLGVPLSGSVGLFVALTAVYTVAAMALGLLLGTVVRTVPQFVMTTLLILAPMIFLSGLFTPTESMGPLLRWAIRILPLRHYVDTAGAVLFRGATVGDVLGGLAAMGALGAALLAVTVARFRASLARQV